MTLSTPFVWVVLPLVIGVISVIFINQRIFGIILTSLTAIGLALLAAFFPDSLTLTIGPFSLTFVERLGILGRQITLVDEMLPFISLIYAMTGLWALSSGTPGIPKTFRPTSMVITALLTAALGVQPFLYAALLIETAVLVAVPMLSPSGNETHNGILRYISLQTLALPLILLAGWLLTGVETLPPDSPLIGQATMVLGLGFALWLGVFPFHSWLPMVSQRSHPAVVTFLSFIMPTAILVFGLNFLNRYAFLRTSQSLYATLQTIGALMIVLGGVWTAVQNNLKRAFGFSVLTETGFSLLAVGLSSQGGLTWMLMLFPVRALCFWLWGFILTLIENHAKSMDFKSIQGFARNYPMLAFGLLIAQLSIAGLPLLAAFPIKISMLSAAFGARTSLGTWSFIGNLGLFLFTIRLLSHLVTPNDTTSHHPWRISEKRHEAIPIAVIILSLIIMGLFPHTFLRGVVNTLTAFTQLQ